jgi:phosphate transport system substrate-binding protein
MFRKVIWATAALTIMASAASSEELRVGGTGSAQGILLRLGEAFHASYVGDSVVVVAGLGSSGGIDATIEGALDLAVTGRLLKSNEREKGLRSGPLLETPFVFVTSHPAAQRLSIVQVIEAFGGKLKAWPDGGVIKPILRPRSDASAAYLVDNLPGMKDALENLRKRSDVPVAATDQDNVEMAQRIDNSLAAMTLVQFITERPKLGLIEIDGSAPSVEAMNAGRYPLKTTLHIVRRSHPSKVVDRFLAFLEGPAAKKIISDSGASPLSGAAQ